MVVSALRAAAIDAPPADAAGREVTAPWRCSVRDCRGVPRELATVLGELAAVLGELAAVPRELAAVPLVGASVRTVDVVAVPRRSERGGEESQAYADGEQQTEIQVAVRQCAHAGSLLYGIELPCEGMQFS